MANGGTSGPYLALRGVEDGAGFAGLTLGGTAVPLPAAGAAVVAWVAADLDRSAASRVCCSAMARIDFLACRSTVSRMKRTVVETGG